METTPTVMTLMSIVRRWVLVVVISLVFILHLL